MYIVWWRFSIFSSSRRPRLTHSKFEQKRVKIFFHVVVYFYSRKNFVWQRNREWKTNDDDDIIESETRWRECENESTLQVTWGKSHFTFRLVVWVKNYLFKILLSSGVQCARWLNFLIKLFRKKTHGSTDSEVMCLIEEKSRQRVMLLWNLWNIFDACQHKFPILIFKIAFLKTSVGARHPTRISIKYSLQTFQTVYECSRRDIQYLQTCPRR